MYEIGRDDYDVVRVHMVLVGGKRGRGGVRNLFFFVSLTKFILFFLKFWSEFLS